MHSVAVRCYMFTGLTGLTSCFATCLHTTCFTLHVYTLSCVLLLHRSMGQQWGEEMLRSSVHIYGLIHTIPMRCLDLQMYLFSLAVSFCLRRATTVTCMKVLSKCQMFFPVDCRKDSILNVISLVCVCLVMGQQTQTVLNALDFSRV